MGLDNKHDLMHGAAKEYSFKPRGTSKAPLHGLTDFIAPIVSGMFLID